MRRATQLTSSVLLAAIILGFGYSRVPSEAADAGLLAPIQSDSPPRASTSATPVFASLPDSGTLFVYAGNGVRREQAAAWYRAEVSEEHALHSLATKKMVIPSPGGQSIQLDYERHVEHPNGNWTWIGRSSSGEQALITFGDEAVFGSIPNGSHELRLTTRRGQSWVVDVDISRERHPEPKKPDYLVPPELAASLASSGPVTASAEAQAITAQAATTVDVALGYTTGYANELGGNSQAVTRLQHLVDVTNQAYSNSQIDAQIRLVRTVAVSFVDATSNDDALTKLSGYQSGTGSVPVDPAFNGLRAARDQYGADLVSLVRRFRTPENQGCGLAWLIGGNQSGIDQSDAPFGYSVVSDDIDKGDVNESDGLTYACRKESLAHELGHNMGQNHNVEDAGGDSGAHPYSYGYREASTSGFYTVMAYKLSGSSQRGVRYFANPSVLEPVSGRPTGVANSSDNARSLTVTMPLVSNFRTTVVVQQPQMTRGLAGDIDGDNKDDVLWFNPTTEELYYWLMDGGRLLLGRGGIYAPAGATPRALADVNNDGRADILIASGQDIWIYLGNSSGTFTSAYLATYPAGWDFVGMGDIDADGKADVVWHHPTTRELYYWLLDGATIRLGRGGVATPAGTAPRLGDLNGDNRVDVLLPSTGDFWVYIGNASGTFTSSYIATYPAGWNFVGGQDMDADGKGDLVWHHPSTGELYYWLMDGGAIRLGRGGITVPGGTTPRILADFNGDGRADVFLPSSEHIWTYQGNASGTFTSFYTAPYPAGWN